jgi:hypothetical protein
VLLSPQLAVLPLLCLYFTTMVCFFRITLGIDWHPIYRLVGVLPVSVRSAGSPHTGHNMYKSHELLKVLTVFYLVIQTDQPNALWVPSQHVHQQVSISQTAKDTM